MYLLIISHLCKYVSTGSLIYCTFMPIVSTVRTNQKGIVQNLLTKNLYSIVLSFFMESQRSCFHGTVNTIPKKFLSVTPMKIRYVVCLLLLSTP